MNQVTVITMIDYCKVMDNADNNDTVNKQR